MTVYYASKAFVRSFSEAVSEKTKGTGVTVTAACPGLALTGFEKTAFSQPGSVMFRHAARHAKAAREAYLAMMKGKPLCYVGAFTKNMSFASRIAPRCISRKFARKMNRRSRAGCALNIVSQTE